MKQKFKSTKIQTVFLLIFLLLNIGGETNQVVYADDFHALPVNLNNEQAYIDKDEAFSSFKISNGYARINEAGVTVTQGVYASMEYSVPVICVNNGEIKNLINNNKDYLTDEEMNKILNAPAYAREDCYADLVCGMSGVIFGDGSWDCYKNSVTEDVYVDQTNKMTFLEALHDIGCSEHLIKCTFNILGTSLIPTEAYCYIGITKIEFSDGTELKILNTDKPIIADFFGKTRGIRVLDGTKLELLPVE